MVDELLCNVHLVKIQIYFHNFLNLYNKERRIVVHLPLILIEITSFAISMAIYHDLSEYPYYDVFML